MYRRAKAFFTRANFQKIGAKIKKGIEIIKGKVGEFKDKIVIEIKKVVAPVLKLWNKLNETFQRIMKNPIVKQLIRLFKCAKAIVSGIVHLALMIQNVITKIGTFSGPQASVAWIPIVIGIICKWEQFARALRYLIGSFKEKDAKRRWNYIGRFLGKLFNILGNI